MRCPEKVGCMRTALGHESPTGDRFASALRALCAGPRAATVSSQCLLIIRRVGECWFVGLFSQLRFEKGTPETVVLEECFREGWALVAKTEGAEGATTYLFRQA